MTPKAEEQLRKIIGDGTFEAMKEMPSPLYGTLAEAIMLSMELYKNYMPEVLAHDVTFSVKQDVDGGYGACFKIGVQEFSLKPNGDKPESAEWMIGNLKHAFESFKKTNSDTNCKEEKTCHDCEGNGWVIGIDGETTCCGDFIEPFVCCNIPIQKQIQVQLKCEKCNGSGRIVSDNNSKLKQFIDWLNSGEYSFDNCQNMIRDIEEKANSLITTDKK